MPAAASDPDAVDQTGSRSGRRPWLAADNSRYAISVAVTVLIASGYGILIQARDPGSIRSITFVATVYLASWALYSTTFVVLTWVALRNADGTELRDWLKENRGARRRRRATEWVAGSGGPLGAVSFCFVAIGAVVAAAILPELRENPVILALAVVVVIVTWLLIAIAFAVHYARENSQTGGLHFPHSSQQELPRLGDYWYLAVQVSTAYNSADVTVTTRHLRSALTTHAVVAFVFNTVLIALLVSLLITVAT